MAPVGYGVLLAVAGVIVLAVLIGALGGVITARLKRDRSLGAIVTAATFILAVILLESWSSKNIAVFGMLPLLLTFVVGSITSPLLESRFHLRPWVSSLAAFGSALFVGGLYLMLLRLGRLDLVGPGTAWIAGAGFCCLIILSIRRILHATR